VGTGDIGVSLLRGGRLVFAIGAVTTVPPGEAMIVSVGPPVRGREDWPRRDTWVDVSISGESTGRLRGGESATVRNYRISVVRSFLDGVPGTHECLAVTLEGACPHGAGLRSAELLAGGNAGLTMVQW
jgi:hypothetical protein